jgi:hypothetical protein
VSKLPETTQAWLRQAAKFEGSVTDQMLLHLLERMDAQEQRPIPGTVEVAAPTPEAAPVATPAGELVERVEARAGGDGRAAIREVAAWAGQMGLLRTERKLREEADR